MIELAFKIVLIDYESDRALYEDSHQRQKAKNKSRQVSELCSHSLSVLCDHY